MDTLIDHTVARQLRTSDIIYQPGIPIRYLIETVGQDHVIASHIDLPAMSRKILFAELVEEKWQRKAW